MRPALLKETIAELVGVKQPVMIWGPPGVGKSDIVRQIADELYGGNVVPINKARTSKKQSASSKRVQKSAEEAGVHFIDLRLSILETVDLRGIPDISADATIWKAPSFLPRSGKGILFIDEIPQAIPSMQAAASQLILNRRIGEYVLPEGWVIVAAGTRESDRASSYKMPSHIANRFTHLYIEVSVDDWVEWAFNNGIDPRVIAFIRMRPAMLHQFDPTQKAFPTPRSWAFVSLILQTGLSKEALYGTVMGTVGEGAANEFVGFLRVYQELIDYDDIVARPMKVHVSENAAVMYATSTMLALTARPKDSRPVFQYINRLKKEFQVLAVMDMGKSNSDMTETRDYIKWQSENQDILLGA